MGSIQYIYKPDKWTITMGGESNISDGDYIYKLLIGYCDDELSSDYIYEFISKENYEKILSGEYFVKTFPYSEQKIIIIDKNKNIISLIKGKDDNEYEAYQKDYVRKLKGVK